MVDVLNQTIGRYQIKEMIGEGAMAKVYRAFDPEINRSVAFKILKDDFCVDEEYLSRFLREAKAAGALSHSNIVTVHDVGKIDKSPYIMMELLEGSDLGDILAEQKKISVQKTLVIGIQLAKALDYAHKSGIVHRDIKPDNIIVLPDGESIKVADFGIARMNETEEVQKTQVGSVLGTPRYMSPEQALGEEVDGKSDLFSVGVILYEMLTGTKAFDASNIGTLMTQITQQQPKPMQDLCPNLPAGLRQIIRKLLHKKPAKRIQTGGELAALLGRELGTLRDQEQEQKKHKYVPLKVRWSIYMGAIVTTILAISMNVVFNIQSKSMTDQAVDSGASFAKFIATETAVPLLSEDWITLETFISEAASRDTFSYLVVTDRVGVVRGASDTSLIGQIYKPDETAILISEKNEVKTTSSELADEQKVFNVSTPVLFQSTEIGQIIIGLSQDSLDEVKGVTRLLMFILAVVTVSSVVLVLFVFGGLIAKPLQTLNKALQKYGDGELDTRISLARNDEIGELFDSFNRMASKAQESSHEDIFLEDTGELTAEEAAKQIEQSQIKLAAAKGKTADEPPGKVAATAAEDFNDSTIVATSSVNLSKAKTTTKKATNAKEAASVNTVNDETIIASSLLDLNKEASKAASPNVEAKSTEKKSEPKPDKAENAADVAGAKASETEVESKKVPVETDSDATIIAPSLLAADKPKAKPRAPRKTAAKKAPAKTAAKAKPKATTKTATTRKSKAAVEPKETPKAAPEKDAAVKPAVKAVKGDLPEQGDAEQEKSTS